MTLTSERPQPSKSDRLQVARRRLRFNSLGLRLFLVITGGVLFGMGGMSLLFGETVKYQAEDQIEATLSNKVSTINDVIDQAETLAYGLNVSVTTLHVRRAETPETYQELVRQLFQGRPDFITGLGFGQAEYGVLPSQQWLFPYYQTAPSAIAPAATEQAEQSDTQAETLYIDQAAPENFYPETARYRDYFLPQTNLWTTPYQSDRGVLLTNYSLMFDPQGQRLGTAVIDVDGTHLSTVLDGPVLRDGGELMLLSATGDVIANPSSPSELGTQTYEEIPGLGEVWSQMGSDAPGFIEGETGYWAYTQIPEQDWVLLAYVPYNVVFGRVMLITLGATTIVGLLLAGMVALVIRYLNRRLQPALAECHRLSEADDTMLEKLQNKDEIDQLSASFFYLLEKHKQYSLRADLVTHQRQLLEKVMTTDGGQPPSQLVTQVQQWVDTTDDLSQTLTEQASVVETVGHASCEALEAIQAKLLSAIADLEGMRQNTSQLWAQMQTLSAATDLSTQMTEKHERIVKVAKALLSDSLPLLTRTSDLQDPNEIENKMARLQRFTTRLQELTRQFSQVSAEHRSKKQQVDGIGAYLGECIRIFDCHIQELASHIEDSQSALEHSKVTVEQITHVGEQVTHSSQRLEVLVQTMQHTVQDAAIAKTA